jgi:hypothetical protein
MGTNLAPPYADIVCYMVERAHTSSMLLNNECFLFRRYLDDVFTVCRNEIVARTFIDKFNKNKGGLIFEESSITIGKSGVFLDIEASISEYFPLAFITKVFQKKLNAYLYIPPPSLHKFSVYINFIENELRRYRFLSSQETDFLETKNLFIARIRDRGYPKILVNYAVLYNPPPRTMTVPTNNLQKSTTNTLFFKNTFNPKIQISFKEIFNHLAEFTHSSTITISHSSNSNILRRLTLPSVIRGTPTIIPTIPPSTPPSNFQPTLEHSQQEYLSQLTSPTNFSPIILTQPPSPIN